MKRILLLALGLSVLFSSCREKGGAVVPPVPVDTVPRKETPTDSVPPKDTPPKERPFAFEPIGVYGLYNDVKRTVVGGKEVLEGRVRRIYTNRINSGRLLPLGTIIRNPANAPWVLSSKRIRATVQELTLTQTSYKGQSVFPNYSLENSEEWLSRYKELCDNYYSVLDRTDPLELQRVGSIYESGYYGEEQFNDLRQINAFFRPACPDAEFQLFGQRYEDETKPFNGAMFPTETLAFSLITDNGFVERDDSSIQDSEYFLHALYFGNLSVLAVHSDENYVEIKRMVYNLLENRPLNEIEKRIYEHAGIVFYDFMKKERYTGKKAIDAFILYRKGRPKVSPLYYTMLNKEGSYSMVLERYEFITK